MSEKKKRIDEFLEQEMKFLADLESVDLERNWAEFRDKLDKRSDAERKINPRDRKRFVFLALAAGILVVLSFSFLLIHFAGKSTLQIQEISTIESNSDLLLEDGSRILLRKGSEISFPESFTRRKRLVNLSGEAYFHVKSKRSPFLIHTRYTTVEVSGTAFNVRESINGDVTVCVKDGEVKFFDKGGKHEKLTLGPGSEGIYRQESESMTRKDLHSENFLFWKTDSLAFKLETLDKVFSSLEEHYNVVIRVMDDEILKHRLTTSFKNQDITSIMDEISEYFDLRYSIRKDTIITEIRP